jgi:anti-sigma factor RsiW
VSLFFHRNAIEASVAGTSTADEETKLRAHLATCVACRGHYDALVLASRAVSSSTEATADELRRERARVEAMVGGATARPAPRRLAFLVLPAALAAGLIAMVLVSRPSDREITERGGTEAPAAPFSISLYAKAKSGDAKVRLVAEFPASGEASLSTSDWVQVTSKATVVVVAVGGAQPRLLPTGSSESLEPGTFRLFAIQGVSADEALRAAKGITTSTKRLPLANPQVTGVLSVQP